MGSNSFSRGALFGFLVLILFAVTFCQADDMGLEVYGRGECADCKEKNILTSHAFSGLRVAIYCKNKDGKFKQKGDAELDEEGHFKVVLPKETLDSEDLKEECYAQLRSASSAPCPAHKGLESSRIIANFDANGEHSFGPAEVLTFFSELCTSVKLWSHYKYPPLSGMDSWKHHFEKHFKAPPQVKKPEPDSEPKKQKPLVPKKPLIPSDPQKPKPVTKPPSEKQPVTKSPSEKPQILKKPCPFPDIPKINIPNIPSKYFHNFKFPYFPPLPPHFLHP